MGLCQVCVHSLQDRSVTEDWFGHHLTLQSFISAAEQGCYFCGRFWAYLSDSQESLKELQALEQEDDILSNSSLNCHKTLCTFMKLEPADLSPLLLMIKLNRDNSLVQPVAAKTFTYSLRLSQSINLTKYTFGTLPNSWDEALSLGERWIYECKNKHLRCNNTTSPGNKLPTRLIDISPVKTGVSLVRIVNGNEIQGHESYCTLSHCWGKAKFLRLTLRNLPDLMKGFSVASLPLTFRDAVQIVQRLKIRYLWIDSLCIIQEGDDGRDWREEARKMQEVYSNSFCNLSAAAATDSSEGLFSTRLPCFYERTEVDLEDTGKDSRQTKSRWTLSDIRMWEIELLNQPLNTRAWVLQERLLSPRILHFSRHQLIWECLTKDACEVFPDEIPPFRSWYDAPDLKRLECTEEMKKGRMINGWSQDEKYSQHHVWSDIVRRYCKCFLTFQTDKMLALAGIAQHMKPRVQDDYVAGMWLRYLASELVWSVVESPGPSLRTEDYVAPSFSWASLPAGVHIASGVPEDIGITVEILCVQACTDEGHKGELEGGLHLCLPLVENFDQIKFGFLHIKGSLKRVKFTLDARQGWKICVRDFLCPECQVDSSSIPAALSKPIVNLDYVVATTDIETFGRNTFYYVSLKRGPHFVYLLLLEVVQASTGIYRRIGLANCPLEEEYRHTLEYLAARQTEEGDIPCQNYDRESRIHTFFII